MAALFTSGDRRIRIESRANGLTWFHDGVPRGALLPSEAGELADTLMAFLVVHDLRRPRVGPSETPRNPGPSEVKLEDSTSSQELDRLALEGVSYPNPETPESSPKRPPGRPRQVTEAA